MIVVPADSPLTNPPETEMLATAVLLLVHVPPGVASVRVVVLPWQTAVKPDIAANG